MIRIEPLQPEDREQFIIDNQEAFNYGAPEEFGLRDDHMEEDGQIIFRDTIRTRNRIKMISSRMGCSGLRKR